MIGKTISHYKIISKLGEGGMGVVYKAEDTKLEREVAIKFLPRQIAANEEERERFKIEAKAAASLNHTNIATIHNIEEVDEEIFIVMENIKGLELKDKIDAGPLSIDDTLNIAIQIANGLKAAHTKDVIHRDIKSANIMLTAEGDVKIMDFGLAKRGGEAKLTKEGTTLGTVAYMSPEQTRGDDVDQRSDIFSLGVLLYEMLTGQLPFKGDYDQAVTYSVLNEEPEPVTALRTGVPMQLEQIVNKCLKKDAPKRYQDAKELIVDLGSVAESTKAPSKTQIETTAQSVQRNLSPVQYGLAVLLLIIVVGGLIYLLNREEPVKSIAVLPFVNSNNDPEIDYLGDGLTEALINRLSQLPQLLVMARSTVFQFKDKPMTPQQIGDALDVGAVLTGDIVKRGDALRLHVELVDVTNGAQIWGEQYNRSIDDILDVQDAVSAQISTNLGLGLSGAERDLLAKRQTNDTEAYQLYLKGRYFWNKRTGEDLSTALSYFEQAIARDPDYAQAHAGIAECYVLLPYYAGVPPRETYPKAKEAALRALQINDRLSPAYSALAMATLAFDWDWELAEEYYLRAIQLNPNYETAHHWYATDFLKVMSRFDEAVSEMHRALALDPLSLIINADLAWVYCYAGSYDLAIAQFQKVIEMDPGFFFGHLGLGRAYMELGETSRALASFREAMRLDDNSDIRATLAYMHGKIGNTAQAQEILAALEKQSEMRYVSPYDFAMIHAGLGNRDRVIQYLQQTLEERSDNSLYLNVDSVWEAYREDPEFIALLKRVGLAE